MTIPTRFHLELDRIVGELPGAGVPAVSTTEDANGSLTVSLVYSADTYAERVSADVAALYTVAGWAVHASWMPHGAAPDTHAVCLFYTPSTPAAEPSKGAARKSR